MKQQAARGKIRKFKGLVTEPVGIVSGGRHLKNEGSALRAEGAVEENHGKARRKVGEFLTDQGKPAGK
jgi:uncharacterized protein YjbJ (UPF0337 family)